MENTTVFCAALAALENMKAENVQSLQDLRSAWRVRNTINANPALLVEAIKHVENQLLEIENAIKLLTA